MSNRPTYSLENSLSILELVKNGMMDIKIAALLWCLAEQKASFIIAAPPRLAGKTTVLNSILQLTPMWFKIVSIDASQSDFSEIKLTKPRDTYILVHEISDHLPIYLWGTKVKTIFQYVAQGYSLASTMHAESPNSIINQLSSDPICIEKHLMGSLDIIINLYMHEDVEGKTRRIWKIFIQSISGSGISPKFVCLSEFDFESGLFSQFDPRAFTILSKRFNLDEKILEKDLISKQKTLLQWGTKELTTSQQLKQVIREYYLAKYRI